VVVFDVFDRSDSLPASHAESRAAFLNRAHTTFWAEVRRVMEEWFARVPADAQRDLRARLRSTDDRQFDAAHWELYLHESLIRAGFSVTLHPSVRGTNRHPDFLVDDGETGFYVEAAVVADSDRDVVLARRRARVFDALDRLSDPNFFLWIDVHREGDSDLATRPLRGGLLRWLATLDPDHVQQRLAQTGDIESVDPFEWQDAGWHIRFRPWPKAVEARGPSEHGLLGVFGPGDVALINDVAPLRRTLAAKGSAYGALDRPFVIAARTGGMFTDDFDVLNALYGTSQVEFGRRPDGSIVSRDIRALDGYWRAPGGWAHTHVSALVIARNLSPWSVAEAVTSIWEHPAPTMPMPSLSMWRRLATDGAQVREHPPTIAPNEFFGLPAGWPGTDPFGASEQK
jgi:hypothetical protein